MDANMNNHESKLFGFIKHFPQAVEKIVPKKLRIPLSKGR